MMHEFSFWQTIAGGGWTLVILAVLSVWALAVIIDRFRIFKKYQGDPEEIWNLIEPFWIRKERTRVLEALEGKKDFFSQIAGAACQTEKSAPAFVLQSGRRAARNLFLILEKRLVILGTLAQLAPFIGLFGTVLGIVRAFRDLAHAEAAGAAVVSQGIAEALLATAMGLFIAILSATAYNYFQNKLRIWETHAEELLERMTQTMER